MADKYTLRDDTLGEEVSASGERAKGALKEAAGSLAGNRSLEREGEREKAEGRARQARNEVIGGTAASSSAASRDSATGRLITGLYDSPDSAGHAYQDLTSRHGYRPDDISVLMSEDTRKRHFSDAKPGEEFKRGQRRLRALAWAAASAWASAPRWEHFWPPRPLLPFPDWASLSPGRLLEPSLVQVREGRQAPC